MINPSTDKAAPGDPRASRAGCEGCVDQCARALWAAKEAKTESLYLLID
jgi:hypothetical protein